MKTAVQAAIEQIRRHFPMSSIHVQEDGDGGAYVIVDPIDLGPDFTEETRKTWIGFHLAYNYPFADIYPHHVRADLQMLGGNQLRTGMHAGNRFAGFDRASVMFSRRTTLQSSWADQTALVKLLKVIEWAGGSIDRRAA